MPNLRGALANLPLPIIGSPLFIISNPKLVIAQCKAGVVGSMPALNARPAAQLDDWLGDLPLESPLRRTIVRTIMRLLFDELFAVQVPSDEWRFAMASVDGFGARGNDRARAG